MQPKSRRLENRRKPTQQQHHNTVSFNSHLHLSPPQNPQTPKPPSRLQSQFPVGSEVEVTSDEEGFKDAWFLATVVDRPPSSSSSSQLSVSRNSRNQDQDRRVLIEYKTLLAEENGSLLTEYVDVSFVRPKPPADVKSDGVEPGQFELDDVVDAYFQDGWWTGVVTQILSPGERYQVFFSNPPHEMEFGPSDMRFHRDWVDGNWVLPKKQSMGGLSFSPGAAVEVSIDIDNTRDVWFPATFIKQVGNSKFLVEYQSSRDAGFQKVAVDCLHIRPSPPSSNTKAFNLLEKVDAFCDCRWLSGVVTKILADGRYIVYFKRTKKEKELCHSDLRPHMEWSDGKWVHSCQDTSKSLSSEMRSKPTVNGGSKEKLCGPNEGIGFVMENVEEESNSTVTLKSSQKPLRSPDGEKANQTSTTSSNKRTKQTLSNGHAASSRPSKMMIEDTASDAPLSPEAFKSEAKLMEGSNDGASVDLDTPIYFNSGDSNLKQSEESNQPSVPVEVEGETTAPRRGRPRKAREASRAVYSPSERNIVVFPLGPIVVGLTHDGKMLNSSTGSSGQPLKEETVNAVEDQGEHHTTLEKQESIVRDVGEQQKEGEVTNLKRKRGRPPKVLFRVGSPKAAETESLEETKDAVSDGRDTTEVHCPTAEVVEPVVDAAGISNATPPSDTRRRRVRILSDQIKHLSEIHKSDKKNTAGPPKRKYWKNPMPIVPPEINEPEKSFTMRRGRKHKSIKQVDPPAEAAVNVSREKAAEALGDGVAEEAGAIVVGTASGISDDDRPLSTWFEGAQSPQRTDGRASLAGIAGQCDESGAKRVQNDVQPVDQSKERALEVRHENTPSENLSQAMMPAQPAAIVPVEDRDLPFVKNSLVWRMIESMDVLKRIPQKPHFRPLYNCKEECREGLAIGSMVTFTSLVERISRLQFDDPKSLMNGYLEALVDLEDLGFNVAPVREKLDTLLAIKGRHEHAENTSKEVEGQILERSSEKSRIDDEISELDRKIAELSEKRADAVSRKEVKEAEIRMLQSSIDAVKGSLEAAKGEFDQVSASLW